VLAIFASRYLNRKPPLIHEDGEQRRDFVSVHDVAQAFRLALEVPGAEGHVLNIGSGRSFTIREVAENLSDLLGCSEIEPQVTGHYRVGDIRNCFADISLARSVLGYRPRVAFDEGLRELAGWLEGQSAVDRTVEASEELALRGLTV
jgi:dTDP-L-rhamnose 4-epimerase